MNYNEIMNKIIFSVKTSLYSYLKTNEVDRLSTELRKWQQDCRDAKDERSRAEQALKQTKLDMEVMKEQYQKYENLQDEHSQLKEQVRF